MINDDMALVREYAAQRSERAFETLVSRYVNLVHSASLRQTRDPQWAAEITQTVFMILSRKAGKLGPNTILPGWLYRTTRYVSSAALKMQRRRERREREAHMLSALGEAQAEASWDEVSPLLDQAMAQLRDRDRDALVLRYFQNKSLREVGMALGQSEAAAQKRVERALERLRSFFARHGVVSTTALLAGTVSANSIQAAPPALVKTITAAAVGKGALAGGSTLALLKGAMQLMTWTKVNTALALGGTVLLIAGASLVTFRAMKDWLAARPPEIQGAWEGTAEVALGPETVQMHAVLRLFKTNGIYHGTVDSPERGLKGVPIYRLDYDYPRLYAELEQGTSTFDGIVDRNTLEISGLYREPALQLAVVLKRTDRPTPVPDPLKPREYASREGSEVQGLWKGVLRVAGRSIRLNFKIAELANGRLRGELDNLDGTRGQWLTVRYQPPSLKLVVNSGAGLFRGQWDENHTKFTGQWIESGQAIPLTLERAVPLYRPIPDQEPAVTARVRGLRLEDLRAEDCTPQFWQHLQQARRSEKPAVAQAVRAALGELRTAALVERTNDGGRPSYLYRMEFENRNALFRLVLDGDKIAFADGYPAPE
jgi:RNA polymerase sigma factor (sigma-70 family)